MIRFTRRQMLELGAAAVAVPRSWLGQTTGLVTKKIPSSGELLPAIGVGTRGYRATGAEERAPLRATLAKFAELGGTVIDTAPSYGNSETVVGELCNELGLTTKVFLATKVDRAGRESAVAEMSNSQAFLKKPKLDLMQVHNLVDATNQLALLREWKAAGKIRYHGVTTSSARQYDELEGLLKKESMDFVQLDYAADNREAGNRLLPLALDRGIAVLVNLPFGRGRLFQKVGERAVPDWAKDIDCSTWAQVFLKYVIGHPAVTCAIPGITKVHHAIDNMGAARGRLPDAAMRRRIEDHLAAL